MADCRQTEQLRPWAPLFATRSDEVMRVLRAICDSISKQSKSEADFTLADGDAGLAVLYAHAATTCPNDRYSERARERLSAAVKKSNDLPEIELSLFEGATGIGLAALHVCDDGDRDLQVDLADLDGVVLRVLADPPRFISYDLINGMTGFAVYALERASEPRWRRALEQMVAHLRATAVSTPGGLTWFTDSRSLPRNSQSLASCPDGLYNLGMAHGVTGIVGLLASLAEKNIGSDEAIDLLDGATDWLLAQQESDSCGDRRWPIWINHAGQSRSTAATWWCYGEPGLAIALLRAAMVLGSGSLASVACEMLREGSRRAATQPGPLDVCLCHGAAGMAQLCARAFQISGDESLLIEATWWYEQLLSKAGKYVDSLRTEPAAALAPGLLTGWAGVALALLAGVSAHEPTWDRMLLLSSGPGV